MKKILTLFMATVVAMSMMAIPQVKKAGNKMKPASKEQFEAKTPAQVKVKELAKDAKVVRNFDRPETAAKKLPAKPAMRVATAQAADTITLHFDGFSVVPEWYEETGDWYMACSQGLWIVKFDILSESYVGTFTEEDLDLYYSYILTENDEYVDYEKVVLTISETQVSQYLTIINLHAVIDGSDGNVYVITCEHSVLSPKDELSHEITGATLTFDELTGLVTLAGENADLNLTMAYWATWPTGRYTSGDLDMEATHVTYQGVEQKLLNVDMVVASGMVDGVLSYAAEVNYYNQDTVLNHVSVVAPIAPATDTVHIEAYNLDVDDSWAMIFGWTYLYGSTSEWNIEGAVASWQAEEGEWAGEDEVMLYLTDMTIGETTEAIYATAEVVMEEESGWKAHLEGLCKDGKYYVIDMKFEVPEATDTVVLSFPNSASAAFYPDLGNDLYLANENDEYFVALDIYGVPMGGEFTYDEMDTYYTQLVKYGETKDEYTMIQIAGVNGVVYQTGDTTWMKAEVTGFDAVLYQVELWYIVPTPTEVVELTVDAAFDNQLEAQGYYTLSGVDETTGLLVAMSPLSNEVAGTFVNDGVFGRFGEGQYDFYSTYTYVAKYLGVDEWGDAQYDIYTIEKGTLTVTLDEEDNILAHASVICSNGVQYEIEMTSVFEEPHLQYDAEYGVEKVYTAADIVTAEYDADYGMAFWQVEAADGSDVCALYFFLEEADAELVIPEGEYAINDTWDYGTVLASTGYDPYNGAAPSLYATLDGEYLNIPLWFMVDGTVTVKHVDGKMKMTVDAVNSYNQSINITYDGTATGSDVEYEVYEDAITNLVIDYDNLLLIGGPSEAFQVEVVLGLGDYDRNTDAFQLLPESSISVLGSEATFVEGWASVDGIEQSAIAVVRCVWNEMALEFHLTMSATPMEATVVVVENATVEIEKYLIFGDTYDYSLKMTGVWTNEGIDYPVLVEVPVYYPEATEPYEIYSTVTVGGWGDDDPWLGFGEGYLTITPEGQKITATGIVENPMAGIAIDITISGTITPTAVEDATVTVKPTKTIKNGQLIIVRDGKEFNAQGAILK